MRSQLAVNQEVPDDDIDYVFVSPPTSLDIIPPGSMTSKHEIAKPTINHLAGSCHNPPMLDNGTQHYDPVFRVTSISHSGAPAIGGNYFTSSSYTGPYNDILYPTSWTLEEFKVHGKMCHFSVPGNAYIECLWDGCTYHKRGDPTVRAMWHDSIWCHTCEAHLGLKRLKKRGT
ncbi:uncharacterized protein EDB91DRAFT_1084915 [Suillus paluster]|uniref:uncharacterized protein n=1 Tax=Suillus paluster TaxID=48578 RepID=UPI001B884CCD|nr:uncharacterized protein EDB91DRAFT_1084915 [Suillus paluster]KAG1731823.1 hypothetical protein EDB91DRAFT_1084915 [Suillus paluster]